LVRKASDLFGLLQTRGRGRNWRSGGSGFFSRLGIFSRFGGAFRSRRSDPGPARGMRFGSAATAAIAFACLGLGYLLGDRFPLGGARDPLQTGTGGRVEQGRDPQRPALLGEKGLGEKGLGDKDGTGNEAAPATPAGSPGAGAPTAEDVKPLRPKAWLCAAYRDSSDGSEALAAARHLAKNGLPLARPYRLWSRDGVPVWTTIVYFDGDAEKNAALEALRTVAAPDALFEHYRSGPSGWPSEMVIR
jgi:hypothetical protein